MINKIFRIIELQLLTLKSKKLTITYKLFFFFYQFIAVIFLIFGKKQIYYLGNKVCFDNPAAIFLLQLYPDELTNKIESNIKEPIHFILDIGGNYGQFSITARKLINTIKAIDVFEPNTHIFKLLENNTRYLDNINIFNNGIGHEGVQTLYFSKNKSGKGSIIKRNAIVEKHTLEETSIKLVSNIPELTHRTKYDLVKIDVEGYEMDVIRYIENIETKYLFIEISGPARKTEFSTAELFNVIREKFGNFDVVYQSSFTSTDECYDALIKFL